MNKIIDSQNTAATEEAGAFLARLLSDERKGELFLVCLTGDLGAGKTAFVRGFASVLSPEAALKAPRIRSLTNTVWASFPFSTLICTVLRTAMRGLNPSALSNIFRRGIALLSGASFCMIALRTPFW